jgi:hypothetical protein
VHIDARGCFAKEFTRPDLSGEVRTAARFGENKKWLRSALRLKAVT